MLLVAAFVQGRVRRVLYAKLHGKSHSRIKHPICKLAVTVFFFSNARTRNRKTLSGWLCETFATGSVREHQARKMHLQESLHSERCDSDGLYYAMFDVTTMVNARQTVLHTRAKWSSFGHLHLARVGLNLFDKLEFSPDSLFKEALLRRDTQPIQPEPSLLLWKRMAPSRASQNNINNNKNNINKKNGRRTANW